MVNIKKTVIGTGTFLLGYFVCLILQHVIPALMDVVEASLGNTVSGIMWFGTIIIWVLAMVVIPIGYIIWGILEETEMKNPVFGFATSALYFVFALAFTYFTWYMITPLQSMFSYPLLIGLFWTGLISLWVLNVIAVPTYLIIETKRG